MKLGMQVGLDPGHIVLDGDPAPPSRKGERAPPIFGPRLLWPNGWMDQDAIWYGCRPQPRPRARWGAAPSPPKKGAQPPQFLAHVCCGQTAELIKMPLGTKVGIGPSRIVLHGDPAPPSQRGTAPNFRSMSIVAKRSPILATAEHLFKMAASAMLDFLNFHFLTVSAVHHAEFHADQSNRC